MKTETKQRIKLALRRFALRWLRKAFDAIEDRLHAAEVRLREDLSLAGVVGAGRSLIRCGTSNAIVPSPVERAASARETYTEWEARRSGVAPVSRKASHARRQRPSAAEFSMRFAR